METGSIVVHRSPSGSGEACMEGAAPLALSMRRTAQSGRGAECSLHDQRSPARSPVDYRVCLNPSASGTVEDDNGPAVVTRALHRSPRPSGRSSRFHGSARIERAGSACLPSFRPRRVSGASGCDDSPVSVPPTSGGRARPCLRVDALHVFPLGAEAAMREVAAEFRVKRGINSRRR